MGTRMGIRLGTGMGTGTRSPPCPHLVLQVDLGGSLVELLLQAGHHRVVPGHAVDAHVLQPSVLHHLAAGFDDQGDVLRGQGGGDGSAGAVRGPQGLAPPVWPYLVVRGGLAVLQPHTEGPGHRFLVLFHDVDAPRGFLGAALIWGEKPTGSSANEPGQMGRASPLPYGDERDGSPGVRHPTPRKAPLALPHAAGLGPTFRDSRILPRGPGCAGSCRLQELGSDPQPTRALG